MASHSMSGWTVTVNLYCTSFKYWKFITQDRDIFNENVWETNEG